jgi:hypothetical protein
MFITWLDIVWGRYFPPYVSTQELAAKRLIREEKI